MNPGFHPAAGALAQIARRERLLAAVAAVAERMAASSPWPELLQEALPILGEATGASRAYVAEMLRAAPSTSAGPTSTASAPTGTGAPRAEWRNDDTFPSDGATWQFARWREQLRNGDPIHGDTVDFPADERQALAARGVYSILAVPIQVGPRWWGVLVFEAHQQAVPWAKVELDALQIAARVVGATIQQQERDTLLRMAQKMEALGRMAGGIAHDCNNLLLILTGELDILRHDLADKGLLDSERAESFALLEGTLRQACTFNRRLLEFSRSREGRPEVLAPMAVLRRAEPLLRQAATSRVTVQLQGTTPEPWTCIDPVQLEQILLNLAVNAHDAMPRGGELLFAIDAVPTDDVQAAADAVAQGPWLRLAVRDTGEGMTPAVLGRIFEPFFTTKAADKGTGLGLSTTYNVVRGAGGHIAVTSAPGVGTEFRIYLPMVDAPAG
jgi:signal transduction histidine kinase